MLNWRKALSIAAAVLAGPLLASALAQSVVNGQFIIGQGLTIANNVISGGLYGLTPQFGFAYTGGAGAQPGITTPVANSVPCRGASGAPTECTTLPVGLTVPSALLPA